MINKVHKTGARRGRSTCRSCAKRSAVYGRGRSGPLITQTPIAERVPCGSLVYSFHENEKSCLAWASRDPYVEAGVFTEPPALTRVVLRFRL